MHVFPVDLSEIIFIKVRIYWIKMPRIYQVSRHIIIKGLHIEHHTEWRTKCHTIDCACTTFLLLQKNLAPGTELILMDWKIVPNEEHVQCDHRFASQPLEARKCSAAQGPHSEVVPRAF